MHKLGGGHEQNQDRAATVYLADGMLCHGRLWDRVCGSR
ncbi:hypothetical protein ADIMK_4136 [Marinobacterium lacunae]|uniref:Uncharacterized protein n=1 Tax=Marinobacterium lacunae TaxID=1232683 RepID=A0A081FT24_9GAMM|nr:hypothetical protein ADIMK_4136 [Marinobacterium lacunae]